MILELYLLDLVITFIDILNLSKIYFFDSQCITLINSDSNRLHMMEFIVFALFLLGFFPSASIGGVVRDA
jgi:hypothetical protein